jgi:hypothetical protein
MKNIFFLLLLLPGYCFSQQNLPAMLNTKKAKPTIESLSVKDSVEDEKEKIPVFTILGLANVNQESLKSFNAGGKASVVIRPYIKEDISKNTVHAIAFYASFNKSASNNDSIVHSKLIFPELGTSSFTGTLQWEKYYFKDKGKTHSSTVFFEMALKSIQADTGAKGPKLFFDALNYTVGYKYGCNYTRDNPFEKGKKINFGFFAAPFISAFNIPDEDRDDYKTIMLKNATIVGKPDDLSDFVVNLGIKMGFHFNSMEFFADLRHVLGDTKVPIRELRGFHANIGFVFNADVLNFY